MKSVLGVLIVLSISFQSCYNRSTCCATDLDSNKFNTEEENVNNLLNKWHQDVIDFNLDSYFNVMDESFIFLGTDPKERWTKNEFHYFCKPYFEKKSTWSFRPLWRNIYFSKDGKTAWFEEQLATWMEECRGSGVLIKVKNKWTLVHYNLAVLIENEKMKSFIDLRKE